MSLGPGSRLGPYEVLGSLGAGGMGQVWRARDTRLDREVALKVLPDELAGSAERRSRLDREARLLASLNHPSIASLFDILDFEGAPVLVMEVVEGETLAERLSRGPLPLKSALGLAIPMAEALEAAHERDILHRDLKPANVKITPEGGTKVLDFGLGKILAHGESSGEGISSSLATQAKPVDKTESGFAVGTAPYMSPEQARGEPVDKRTDVWAFGCVVFEMLTGRRAFGGATRSDALAAVLEHEPDWGSLPEDTPGAMRRILERCLQKDKRERLRDIGDVRLQLKDLLLGTRVPKAPVQHRRWVPAIVAGALVATLAVLSIAFLRPMAPPTDVRLPRFQLSLPRGVSLPFRTYTVLAVSPDGAKMAFVGCQTDGGCQLYLRDQSEIDARPLPGTEGAICPFFSPDGRSIAFGAQGKLKKIDLEHGAVVALTDAPTIRGGSWGDDGIIFFSRGEGGLLRVSADGGEVQEMTKPDRERKEFNHRWPEILPGGRALLFEVHYDQAMYGTGGGSRGHAVAVADLETGTKRILVESAGDPKYVSGHVVFGREGVLYAAPMDLERLELIRPPVSVLPDVAMWSSPGTAGSRAGNVHYDIARDGTLLFSPREAGLPKRTLVLVDRNGRREPVSRSRRSCGRPPLFSPDGRRIAMWVQIDVGSRGAFVVDITTDAWTRVRHEPNLTPLAWMPDGKRLLLTDFNRDLGLLLASVDGSQPAERLPTGDAIHATVAHDGSALLFVKNPEPGQVDIWRLPLTGQRDAAPWLATPSEELSPNFSPDGSWVAYVSNDSGRRELYVRPYVGSGGRHQVSTQGGRSPRWSRDGREIFFESEGSLWSAAVRTSPSFASDPPRKLFDLSDELLIGGAFYDASPDSQRFVMVEKDPFELRPLELVVIPDWIEELKARLAAAK